MVQQFRGKNRRNVFSSFFQYSGLLSEFIPNFSSVTRKAIMYKWYKNTSLSKIFLIDYHSSLTQWSSVVLFIRWAAEGGNIFLKVSTILFSFQIHFLRVCFWFVFFFFWTPSFCYVCWDFLYYLLFSCQACSAWPVKSIMLVFFGSNLKCSSFHRKTPSLIDFFSPSVWKNHSPSVLGLGFSFLWFRRN